MSIEFQPLTSTCFPDHGDLICIVYGDNAIAGHVEFWNTSLRVYDAFDDCIVIAKIADLEIILVDRFIGAKWANLKGVKNECD